MKDSLIGRSTSPRHRNNLSSTGRAYTTAYFAGLDANLQLGLALVFCLYLVVTVGTFSKLPSPGTTGSSVQGILEGHNNNAWVRRAKVLLRGKYYKPATTPEELMGLIQQEEAKLKETGDQEEKLVDHSNSLRAVPQPPPQQQPEQHPAFAQVARQSPQIPVNVDLAAIAQVQRTFPIRACDDMEEIDHPGYQYADFHGPNPPPAKMKVPKYWNPPAYGGDVRQYLGDYGKRLITPQEALSIGSKTPDGQETIYITIASYRDPECPITIFSIFTRAQYPERLRVAVIDQRLDGDMHCITPATPCAENPDQVLCKYAGQIEALEMDARLGIGPVFARHLGYRHYRGEYFAMQVDAHVRFVEHWDRSLVEQWHQANNEMAVLSTYLSDLNKSIDPQTHKAIRPGRPIMCATDYEGTGKYKHLRHGQQPEGPAMIHGEPTLHPFWAAGFSFGRGHFVVQVPYDQYLPM
jgi:Glycosyltransferase (GlcNAc)